MDAKVINTEPAPYIRSRIFKIDYDSTDYKDIYPSWKPYVQQDIIINHDHYKKGDIEKCVWKKYKPTQAEINSPAFREQEVRRILKTGVFIWIKEEFVWIPPNYYFALMYGKAGANDLQFRLKRLKHVYFKIRVRNNPGCVGSLSIKNRGDGETTMAIMDAFWECLDGNMETGQIGLQSRTRGDAINPCWNYVQTLWQSLPKWLKDELCSDFASGTNIAEKIKFMRDEDEANNKKARNVLFTFYPSGTPMDGKHDMKKCILDEVCKWEECNFYDVFTNYSKFIIPGFERRGIFDMFSSPADHSCRSNEEVYTLWKDSDPSEITSNGTTKSRIHRYYSNPLDGIAGAYDMYGDADPDKIHDHIMTERKKLPKDKLLAEVRGYPLNEQEMFESTEESEMWSNQEGIVKRKNYLFRTRFKDEKTQEPKCVYGNLEWKDGVKDHLPIFKMADKTEFDIHDARVCFSYMPDEDCQYAMANIFNPPNYVENCIGIDSVDKRYPGKRPSNFAMVNHKFRDIKDTKIVRCPTMIYCNRPLPIEISYEDAIKAAVFNRSMVQVESLNTKIVDYFEDRGYINWMISKIGHPKNSLIKGDAPSGKSAFIDEIVGMLDAITNVPVNEGDPNLLELNWFYELLDDLSKFSLKDTHARDLSMAWGQSLLGSAKIMFKKVRQKSELNEAVMDYMFN